MYHQCTTEKTATQQKLFTNTLHTLMQTNLLGDITITELCKQSGLTRNIFYRLFDCKEDVLFAIIDSYFYECGQYISIHKNNEHLLNFFTFWKEHKELLDLLDKNQLNHLLASRGTYCCSQMDFGMQKYIHKDYQHSECEIFSFYIGGFIGLLYHWYHTDFKKSEKEMADISLKLLKNIPLMDI